VAGENFGCGSSREHAVWALMDAGFRAVVAPSFSDIFRNNCLRNGMLPVTLTAAEVQALIDALVAAPGSLVAIDLPAQTVRGPEGGILRFAIDPFAKACLLEGLDEIALTLSASAEIDRYERERKNVTPWLFGDLPG
jgi:3-isopropylmalate/(R)-2-methylmalate dehydratase small subunit